MNTHKSNLKTYQKELRQNLTDAEQILWHYLRNRKFSNLKFRRQQIIHGYIIDFVCYDKKLIIEIDGSQHCEKENYDNKRTKILEDAGFKVLRFWNNEVCQSTCTVLEVIYEVVMI